MADVQYPAIKIFARTQAMTKRLDRPVTFYVNRSYLTYFPADVRFRTWKHALRKRWEVWRDFRYVVPPFMERSNVVPFDRTKKQPDPGSEESNGWHWAKTLDDPLCFFRGTLTSTINLATILWPDRDVTLLGVDLNSNGYFFDSPTVGQPTERADTFDAKRMPEESVKHHERARRVGIHSTALPYETERGVTVPSILNAIPRIRQELARTGRELYCANPDSLLVTEGLCPLSPILH